MLCNEVMEDVVASRRSMVNIIPGEALRCAGVNDATLQHLKQFLNTICLYVFSMLSHVVSFFFYTLYVLNMFAQILLTSRSCVQRGMLMYDMIDGKTRVTVRGLLMPEV